MSLSGPQTKAGRELLEALSDVAANLPLELGERMVSATSQQILAIEAEALNVEALENAIDTVAVIVDHRQGTHVTADDAEAIIAEYARLASEGSTDQRMSHERKQAAMQCECAGCLAAKRRNGPPTGFRMIEEQAATQAAIHLLTHERSAEAAPPDVERPRIVCICGSTRFADHMNAEGEQLTLDGYIVVRPEVIAYNRERDQQFVEPEVKERLDVLHLRKIDLADEVVVVTVDGYIGESTRREIAYAESTGKPPRYAEYGCGSEGTDR